MQKQSLLDQGQDKVRAYNDDAEQAYLKALTGGEGSWRRHAPRTNLIDLINSAANDN